MARPCLGRAFLTQLCLTMAKFLIRCGWLSSLYYILINLIVPPFFEGYNWVSQTVSELSAVGSPTRTMWVILAIIYVLLFGLFGLGVRASSANRRLNMAGKLMLLYSLINIYWPPMHLRGNAPGLTDTLHIVWAVVTIILMLLIMGYGAAGMGRSFRIYTVLTIGVFLLFGVLIATEAPGIPKNLPTPYIGIWERTNIGVFMLWVAVFSKALISLTYEKDTRLPVSHQTAGHSHE